MKKSLFAVLVLVLGLSMVLTACGSNASAPAEADAPTSEETAVVEEAPAEEAAAEEAPAEEAPAEEAPAEEVAAEEPAAESTSQFAAMDGAVEMTAEEKAAVETVASAVAESAGLSGEFSYEAWTLPADTTWDTVLAYYDQQAVDAGWTADAAAVQEIENGNVALFGNEDGSMFVLVFVQGTDSVDVLALTGTSAE